MAPEGRQWQRLYSGLYDPQAFPSARAQAQNLFVGGSPPQQEATETESILVHHSVVLLMLTERIKGQVPYGEIVSMAEIDEKFN